jgi:hypothetical protein
VNNYEQIIKQLVESSPSWEKDGGGIRGRTLAPILSGLSSGGAMNDFGSQQFNQNNNESIQRTASDPIADLILTSGGGGRGITPHPWQILLRLNEDGDPEFKVELNSDLYSGLGTWDEVPITGLNTWIAASTGYITLRGTVSSGVVVGAEIIGPLVDLPERVVFSGSTQTDFSALLGYLSFQDEQLTVRQISYQNFTLINSCINGNPAIYPIVT